jgi:hypothetical protein
MVGFRARANGFRGLRFGLTFESTVSCDVEPSGYLEITTRPFLESMISMLTGTRFIRMLCRRSDEIRVSEEQGYLQRLTLTRRPRLSKRRQRSTLHRSQFNLEGQSKYWSATEACRCRRN